MPKYNMKNDKAPNKKKLLPKGWRKFTILDCQDTTSKAGNSMYKFSISDCETGYGEDIYAVNVDGKRWFLKMMLEAVGIKADEEGNYDFETDSFVNKEFMGLVEHKPNDWINREGKTVNDTQHKITEVKGVDEINGSEEVTWGEQK